MGETRESRAGHLKTEFNITGNRKCLLFSENSKCVKFGAGVKLHI